jgi:hypothetical protein
MIGFRRGVLGALYRFPPDGEVLSDYFLWAFGFEFVRADLQP